MLLRPIRKPPFAHPTLVRILLLVAWGAVMLTAFVRCDGAEQEQPAAARVTPSTISSVFGRSPDELPAMRNAQPPFRYPAALYAQKVQGNVTLRLYVDTAGTVVGDSTRVEESSGHVGLDSAALLGARDLRFTPAKRRGSPVAVSLLYPVYFRHPEADPLPGDSVLGKP
jgi:TonB family protein